MKVIKGPLSSARFVTFFRACSYKEKNEFLHSADNYAQQFISTLGRLALWFSPIIIPIIKKSALGSYDWIVARTLYLDHIMGKAQELNFEQIVILGAGFDSRSLRFGKNLNTFPFFEVDLCQTQLEKIKALKNKKILIPLNLHFVSVDFNSQKLDVELFKSGFKKDAKNLFIWEGVTRYLTQEGIDATLKSIYSISATGSEVALTYHIRYQSKKENKKLRKSEKYIKKWIRRRGTSFDFSLEENEIKNFLRDRGFRLLENKMAQDLDELYFKKANGKFAGHVTLHSAIALVEVL